MSSQLYLTGSYSAVSSRFELIPRGGGDLSAQGVDRGEIDLPVGHDDDGRPDPPTRDRELGPEVHGAIFSRN